MKKTSMRDSSARVSPLENTQFLKTGGVGHQKKHNELAVALPLTSLIDAFTIIVIYLLIGTQSGGIEMNVAKGMQLPVAESGSTIDQETSTVRIEHGQYFINDEVVSASQLGEKLNILGKTMKDDDKVILVQADQKMDYALLDPILRAGSEAGIQKLKFAVVPPK